MQSEALKSQASQAFIESHTLINNGYDIHHHGAVKGVTGSCHELQYLNKNQNLESVLIDCGLFQGIEAESEEKQNVEGSLLATQIPFEIHHIKALVVTHVHIDHVGRIPHLLAKGFKGPIYCSEPSAKLLPLVLEDAVKIGFTRNKRLIEKFLSHIEKQIVPVKYGKWQQVSEQLKIKLKPAGHILGSAYVTCKLNLGVHPVSEKPHKATQYLKNVGGRLRAKKGAVNKTKTIIFTGDLGAPHTPILNAPKSPFKCDTLVMESTYGDKNHESRKDRRQRLKAVIEKALQNQGTVLIPAFSIGRTQELLYELEELIHQSIVRAHPVSDQKNTVQSHLVTNQNNTVTVKSDSQNLDWNSLQIIIDSPLAAKFTDLYRQLKPYWDKEALRKLKNKRNPLKNNNVLSINTHKDHLNTVQYLAKTKRPAIVIAASGMCNGGRIMNYLKAMLGDNRHDVLFIGYQARGTMGRKIQKYGPAKNGRKTGYIDMDGQRISIQAEIHTIGGYSAHAGQKDLLNFVKRMWFKPKEIRLIHGDETAKETLKDKLNKKYPKIKTWIPR